MRNKSLTLSISLVLFTLLFSNFTVTTDKINTELLCKTWYIVAGEIFDGKEKESLPEDMINGKFIFYKNYKVMLVEPNSGEAIQGTWKDKGGKLYVDIDNDPMSFTLKTLTKNKLIISASKEGMSVEMTLSSSKKE